MTRPIISIHEADGNETQRPMNNDEYAQWQKDAAEAKAIEDAKIKAEADKKAAQEKLLALGLTKADLIAMGLMVEPVEPA